VRSSRTFSRPISKSSALRPSVSSAATVLSSWRGPDSHPPATVSKEEVLNVQHVLKSQKDKGDVVENFHFSTLLPQYILFHSKTFLNPCLNELSFPLLGRDEGTLFLN
jgi:hypothetical protein